MLTEKEKMLAGNLYNANGDNALISERKRAKQLTFKYNHLDPARMEDRKNIILELFGAVQEGFLIEQPFYCDYGYNIFVGSNFYANVNCIFLDVAKITIGDNVCLAPGVGLYTAGHPLDMERRSKGLEFGHPITIGHNVWIGASASVMPGITIGDNTVIGAGSVVTKDIPANVLAVGNPCKVVRKITENGKDA